MYVDKKANEQENSKPGVNSKNTAQSRGGIVWLYNVVQGLLHWISPTWGFPSFIENDFPKAIDNVI